MFGRAAMGETVDRGAFSDRWRVRRDGRLVLAENLRLDGAVAEMLAEPRWPAARVAVATVLAVPDDPAMAERVRAQTFCGEVGVSAWNGLAVVRLCAKDGAGLRRDLATAVAALGGRMPRLWMN